MAQSDSNLNLDAEILLSAEVQSNPAPATTKSKRGGKKAAVVEDSVVPGLDPKSKKASGKGKKNEPIVILDSAEHTEPIVATGKNVQKIKQARAANRKWQRIKRLGYPEKIDLSKNPKSRKKYRIYMQFVGEDGAEHQKHQKFGDVKRDDFIDHKDEDLKECYLSKQKIKPEDPFHPKFWDIRLLNSKHNEMSLAYSRVRDFVDTTFGPLEQ